MNDKTPPKERTGAPRCMKILLVVSLALNLLIAGGVVGAALSGGKWSGHHMRADGPGGPLTRALSEQDRRVLKRRMFTEFMSERDARGAHRQAMQGLLAALRADPYDPAEVEAQMDAIRTLFMGRMATGQALLSQRLAELNETERLAYADRLEQALRRRH